MSTIRLIPKPGPVVISSKAGSDGVYTPAFPNNTGNIIAEGTCVYIDDQDSMLPALASAAATAGVVGFATKQVNPGASAQLAISGLSAYHLQAGDPGAESGEPLYLSATEAGKLTSQAPEAVGTAVVQVGAHMSSRVLINVRIMMEYT
jgi:hypothetical protein